MGRRWLLGASTVFFTLLLVWIAAAFLLSTASAEDLPISMRLASLLQADYNSETGGASLGPFRLSIVGDVLRDEGKSPQEADDQSELIKKALELPIPTATARNFEGEEPFTATPSPTSVPSKTPEPTATYKPTNTKEPTKTPTSKPTQKPADSDNKPPVIGNYEEIIPSGGGLESCSAVIRVYGLRVEDPAYSKGIEWLRLKYQDPVSGEWVTSSPFYPSPPDGWTVGEKWVGYYDLLIEVNISPSCTPGESYSESGPAIAGLACLATTSCSESLSVKAWVKDKAGNEAYETLKTYTVPESCVWKPEPEPEPEPEPTPID